MTDHQLCAEQWDSWKHRAEAAEARADKAEAACADLLQQRDYAEEWADKLAESIAAFFAVDIGEHSNANNPWLEAFSAVPLREGWLPPDKVKLLVEALKPFAKCIAKSVGSMPDDKVFLWKPSRTNTDPAGISIADIKRAKQALAAVKE